MNGHILIFAKILVVLTIVQLYIITITSYSETYYNPTLVSYPYDPIAKKIHLFVERAVQGYASTIGYMYIVYTPQSDGGYAITASTTFYGYGLISLISPTWIPLIPLGYRLGSVGILGTIEVIDRDNEALVSRRVFLYTVRYVYEDGKNWFWVPIIMHRRNYVTSLSAPMYAGKHYKIGIRVGMHAYINEVPDLGPGPYITHYGLVDFHPNKPGSGSEVGKIVVSSNIRYEDWVQSAEGIKWNYLTVTSLSLNPGCPILAVYGSDGNLYTRTKILEPSESWFWASSLPLDRLSLNIPYKDIIILNNISNIIGEDNIVKLNVYENGNNVVFINNLETYVIRIPRSMDIGINNNNIVIYKHIRELLNSTIELSNNGYKLNFSINEVRRLCNHVGIVISTVSRAPSISPFEVLPKSPLIVEIYLGNELLKKDILWIHNIEDKFVIELDSNLCRHKDNNLIIALYTPANILVKEISLVNVLKTRILLRPLGLKEAILRVNNSLVNISDILKDSNRYVVLKKGNELRLTYIYEGDKYHKHENIREYLVTVVKGFYIPGDWYKILGTNESLNIMAYKIPGKNAYYLFPVLRSYDNIVNMVWKVNGTTYNNDILVLNNLTGSALNVTLTVNRIIDNRIVNETMSIIVVNP